jgi:AcrR family transcriptional regulator
VFESNAVQKSTTTKWGDREQRRIDILDAARALIAERGYLALNMRDLAAGAGVSPATLYSYFATKEVLFATLYAEAIRAHTEAYRSVAEAGHDLDTLLQKVIEGYLPLFQIYGRHFTLWSELRRDADAHSARVPKELVAELRAATVEHNRLLMDSIRTAARRHGRRVVDDRAVASFVWCVLNGLGDHFASERRALDRYPAATLIEFSARRLAVAISEPDG